MGYSLDSLYSTPPAGEYLMTAFTEVVGVSDPKIIKVGSIAMA